MELPQGYGAMLLNRGRLAEYMHERLQQHSLVCRVGLFAAQLVPVEGSNRFHRILGGAGQEGPRELLHPGWIAVLHAALERHSLLTANLAAEQ